MYILIKIFAYSSTFLFLLKNVCWRKSMAIYKDISYSFFYAPWYLIFNSTSLLLLHIWVVSGLLLFQTEMNKLPFPGYFILFWVYQNWVWNKIIICLTPGIWFHFTSCFPFLDSLWFLQFFTSSSRELWPSRLQEKWTKDLPKEWFSMEHVL